MRGLYRGLALRWAMRHRLRAALAGAAVALGVAAFLGTAAVGQSLVSTGRAAASDLAGGADLSVEAAGTGLPLEAAVRASAVPGVAFARPLVLGWVRLSELAGERALVVGVEPANESEAPVAAEVDVVDPFAFLAGRGAVVARPLLAELGSPGSFGLQGAAGERRFSVAGTFEPPGATGRSGRRAVVLPLRVAAELLGRAGRVDRVDVRLAEGAEVETVASSLRSALADLLPAGATVGPPRAGDRTAEDVMGAVTIGLRVGAGIALLVGVFLIHHTISVGVTERRREIGVLRAIGATRAQVRGVFAAEAAGLGLAGSLVGLGLGWLLARSALDGFAAAIASTYFPEEPAPVETSPALVAAALAAGVLTALLAAWVPAARAAAEPPSDAIRRGPEERSASGVHPARAALVAVTAAAAAALAAWPGLGGRYAGYHVLGLALVAFVAAAPALVALGARALGPVLRRTGVPGRLAADELAAHPGRAALPAAALAVGLALVVETLGLVHSMSTATVEWMETNVAGDLFVSSGSTVMRAGDHTPLDDSLVAEVARVPGVGAAVGVRFLRVPWRGTRVLVLGIDSAPLRGFGRLEISGISRAGAYDALGTGSAALVSDNFAVLHGVDVGDEVVLPGADGPVRVRVVGRFPDLSWPRGTLVVDRVVLRERFADRLVDEVSVKLAPGAGLVPTARRVEQAVGAGRELVVTPAEDLRAAARELLEDFFQISYAQVAVALAVAFLGVVNALWIAVVLRRREIGLLRAVGATRRQVMGAFVLQAAALGVLGAALGLAGGVLAEWVVLRRILPADTGWVHPLRLPVLPTLGVALLGITTSALAGLLPARLAAGIPVREAVGYE